MIGGRGIERGLHHLVLLRASQMNKCSFCVQMHSRDARKDDERNQRLDHLVVWRQMADFTPREKAAFAWTEALTELKDGADLSALRDELRALLGAGDREADRDRRDDQPLEPGPDREALRRRPGPRRDRTARVRSLSTFLPSGSRSHQVPDADILLQVRD